MHQSTIAVASLCALFAACGGNSPPDLPPCASGDCSTQACTGSPSLQPGGLAGPATQPASCQHPLGSASGGGTLVDLGAHTVGDTVSFEVPSGTGGLTILSRSLASADTITYAFSSGAKAVENTVVPQTVTDPSGRKIYDDIPQPPADPSSLLCFYGGSSGATGALTLPNAAPLLREDLGKGGLPNGTWQLVVSDLAFDLAGDPKCAAGCTTPGRYQMSVLLKPQPIPRAGALNIGFYLVGNVSGVTSATAPQNPAVKRMVQTLTSFLGAAGVCVGTVTFYDVPAWARAAYASISSDDTTPCGKLDQMFTLSKPGELSYFLVDELTTADSSGGRVVGVDGTIPGPPTVGGTVHSGAAVSAADLFAGICGTDVDLHSNGCGADLTGYVAAHEGGHFLGLYHTTEQDGERFDPLTDTATCSCEACAPSAQRSSCNSPGKSPPPSPPTLVFPPDCTRGDTCGGGDNLMFWQLDAAYARGNLTTQQAQVMRASPLVR